MTCDPLVGGWGDRKLQGSQDEEPVTQGYSATLASGGSLPGDVLPHQPVPGQTDGYKHQVAITEGRAGREQEVPGVVVGGPRISSPSAGQVSLTWEGPLAPPSCPELLPRKERGWA